MPEAVEVIHDMWVEILRFLDELPVEVVSAEIVEYPPEDPSFVRVFNGPICQHQIFAQIYVGRIPHSCFFKAFIELYDITEWFQN